MKAGWKNRIDERRYFEEKKELAQRIANAHAIEQRRYEFQKEKNMLNRATDNWRVSHGLIDA